jgi:nucleoside-triphosphatase THEP1
MMNNILIQGDRQSGKTHLICRITERYRSVRVAGFATFKDTDGIVYFRAFDSGAAPGQKPDRIIYREDDGIIRSGVFDQEGVRAVNHAMSHAQLIIFDELGRFEQDCETFTHAIGKAFSSATPVLAALKNESNPFLDYLRRRSDSVLHTISVPNRDGVFTSVARHLDALIGAT